MSSSILWHDYETWGVDPKRDFPAQFAAIRTDENLNLIGKPINWFCKIPNDYLPNPEACLVTKITPQMSLKKGFIETEFADKICKQMSVSGTCVAGYNSIRFDDEVSRNLFYRNFLPVYEREWMNGNSRWDIIDLVRAAHALRPEGIEWVFYDNGKPCFKLDRLSPANNIGHENAHDALSDVYATIEIAKLIKEKQRKLYDYYWQCRNKDFVMQQISLFAPRPFVHVSGFISSLQSCCSLFYPLCMHPGNKNAVICIDLNKPMDTLLSFLQTGIENIPTQVKLHDLGLISIKINQCPFVAPRNVLNNEVADRIGIDLQLCAENENQLRTTSNLSSEITKLFSFDAQSVQDENVDLLLYKRGFPNDDDKRWMHKVRASEPDMLQFLYDETRDEFYRQQLFKYQGRNYPLSFDESSLTAWSNYRLERFEYGKDCLSLTEFTSKLNELYEQNVNNPQKLSILKTLAAYTAML